MNGVSKIVPPEARDHQGHLAVVLPRRQDRPARPQRLGQIDRAADHGRRRHRLQRRGAPAAGHQDRLSAAGAAARSGKDRARGGRGRRRRDLRGAGQRSTRSTPAYAEEGADFDKLAAEQQRLEAILAASDAHTLERTARNRRRRAAPAAVGREDRHALRRREAPRRAVPPAAVQARHAAARRADQPSRRRIGRVAGALPRTSYPGTVVAVTHDRYFLDNAAEWILELDRGRGIPWKGNYSVVAGAEGRAPAAGRSAARRRAARRSQRELEWVRQDAKGRQSKGKARLQALRGAELGRIPAAQRDQRDLHPAGRAPRRSGDRVQERVASRSATAC